MNQFLWKHLGTLLRNAVVVIRAAPPPRVPKNCDVVWNAENRVNSAKSIAFFSSHKFRFNLCSCSGHDGVYYIFEFIRKRNRKADTGFTVWTNSILQYGIAIKKNKKKTKYYLLRYFLLWIFVMFKCYAVTPNVIKAFVQKTVGTKYQCVFTSTRSIETFGAWPFVSWVLFLFRRF